MDIDGVKKLALLARLEVPDAELAQVATEMGSIIGLVDEIKGVDVSTTEAPLQSVNVFRDDTVAPIEPAYDLIEAAALHQDHFVKVPKVIGE